MKMQYRKFLIFFLLVCCTLNVVHAEMLKVPYQYGFEKSDPEENNWNLEVGPLSMFCTDQWKIGNLEHSEGKQALYISCDRGKSSNYGSSPNVVIASRVLELETGNYDISFDWRVWGEKDVSELYVCALPEGYVASGGETLESNDTIGYFPKVFARFIKTLTTVDGERQALSGATTWTNASFQMSVVGGRKVQLAFVWVNANNDTTLSSPLGACIDNVQINSAMCPRPENLRAEASCGVINLQWDGVATKYECGYKRIGKQFWNNTYDIDGEMAEPSVTWDNIEEGAYDVRVRAILDEDTSAYVYLNTVVVWCSDNHCFDFVTLDNKDVVTCYAGGAIMSPLEDSTEYTFAQCPPVDFGSNSIHSRHTTNWDQSEVDPRTGNKLTLIPPGEMASVRLGNWNSGAQAERITYKFNVVDDLVLLMKYAVVLEKPGHGEALDPYFGLEILREDGSPITENTICGEAFFSPEKGKWKKAGNYVYKEWTTIGIDLRSCKGENVIVQLTTQDCYNGAHGGYAYFHLDCIDAVIKSDGCEDITLKAPSGFRYNWYNLDKPEFKSTKDSIIVKAGDVSTYYCEINYIDTDECTFTLSSSVLPHNPKAAFTPIWEPKNCNNIVRFDNTSYVYANVNGVDSIIPGKSCEAYKWVFEYNGEETITDLISPRYTMPNEGGNLRVRLSAYLGDTICNDVFDTTIVVPEIHGHEVEADKRLCYGTGMIFGENFLFESGVYIDTLKNIWGCDSIVTLNLSVRPQIEDTYAFDTLCSSEPYIIGDYRLDSAGVYTLLLRTQDELQCDSVVILTLEKYDPIVANVAEEYRYSCADDSMLLIDYTCDEDARRPFVYSVVYDQKATANRFVDRHNIALDLQNQQFEIVLPDSCRPDSYEATIVVHDTITACGDLLIPIKFDVYYSSSIMEPKFNNLITILDKNSNGGYEFDEYRWYKNNELIPGEEDSYLFIDGDTFGSDCFYLELKRKDDGVVMRTCPICPGNTTPIDDVYLSEPSISNTLVAGGQRIVIDDFGYGKINVYTATGQLINSVVSDGVYVELSAPYAPGVYLLEMVTTTETFVTKIIVNRR